MTASRVVFDCNVFLQALGRPRGPSGRCVQLFLDGKVSLFVSLAILAELREVTGRPTVISKLGLVPERVAILFDAIKNFATLVNTIQPVFNYGRDPDDSEYVNLAIASDAHVIVSRDNDLLDLMNPRNPQHDQFVLVAAETRVLDPVQFLREFDASRQS